MVHEPDEKEKAWEVNCFVIQELAHKVFGLLQCKETTTCIPSQCKYALPWGPDARRAASRCTKGCFNDNR